MWLSSLLNTIYWRLSFPLLNNLGSLAKRSLMTEKFLQYHPKLRKETSKTTVLCNGKKEGLEEIRDYFSSNSIPVAMYLLLISWLPPENEECTSWSLSFLNLLIGV